MMKRMLVIFLLCLGFISSCNFTEKDPETLPLTNSDSAVDVDEDLLIIDSTGHTNPEDSLTLDTFNNSQKPNIN